jgi:hypothetical protein
LAKTVEVHARQERSPFVRTHYPLWTSERAIISGLYLDLRFIDLNSGEHIFYAIVPTIASPVALHGGTYEEVSVVTCSTK